MQRGASLPSLAGGGQNVHPGIPSTSQHPMQAMQLQQQQLQTNFAQHQQQQVGGPQLHQQPAQQYQQQQASSNPHSLHMIDLDRRITSLGDSSQRDDTKLKILQEIWASVDQCHHLPAYQQSIENLIHCFIKLFSETSPQFISENNTQQLRKLMLEVILRMSNIDAVKNLSKEIQRVMMRLIGTENEENAILAIKIIVDQGRSTRVSYTPDVANVMQTCKTMIRDLSFNAQRMFDNHSPENSSRNNKSDEELISEALSVCFHTQTITLFGTGQETKYNLIPRASQSVKCLQEVPMLIIFFYQYHKLSVQTDALEFLNSGLTFINMKIYENDMSATEYNRSLADDFCLAQSKILNFINIIGKVSNFMELIQSNGNLLVSGVLQILDHCPDHLINVRKDVLLTLKYFFGSEIRNKFFNVLPRLISETTLLGKGFTSIDHLRTFMYQILADLLHHMRLNLSFSMLSHIAFIFCRQLHDPTVSFQVQIMATRLLNSITECMARMEAQGEATRDVLMDIMEALVSKLKVLAVYHLPLLFQQHSSEVEYDYKPPERHNDDDGVAATTSSASPTTPTTTRTQVYKGRRCSVDSVQEMELPCSSAIGQIRAPTKEGKQTTPDAMLSALWAVTPPPIMLAEGRNLIKFIFQTCKYATTQLKDTRITNTSYSRCKERDLYERLLRYGILCMDVFIIPHMSSRGAPQQIGQSRSKDEKDSLESLASVFTSINHGVFRELFTKYMDFLFERIFKNFPLQIMVNTFLVRNEVPFFAEILLKYLMSRMPCLSLSNERTSLYVKMFKIIFSAIGTHHPNVEGEKMLKPYLPDLIRRSTTLALSAREPLNYFLLLRALFRSIGGGAHDILYGKFLPLLPNLLQFLNKLQSCQHRLQMRELFVELCLTVPVRLSSLLPYLPLLMDPLVCALNGSPSLVQQGLRTLELCVDNLQPDYLFEHMAPVRGALMQGLWRVVGTSVDPSSAAVAFRILGKFGGANRRMLNEPQQLQVTHVSEMKQAHVGIDFERHGDGTTAASAELGDRETFGLLNAELPLNEVMRIAVDMMRTCAMSQTDPNAQPPFVANQQTPYAQQIPSLYLRQQFMDLARSVLLAGLGSSEYSDQDWVQGYVDNVKGLFIDVELDDVPVRVYKCPRECDRQLYINALLVLFYGVVGKDLRPCYLKLFNAVLRQLSLQGVLEFVGGNRWLRESDAVLNGYMDAAVLVDALACAFSDSNKEFCYSAVVALRHIKDTCIRALKSPELMSRVPFCRYLLEKLMQLCYGPAWFARLGGASALSYMIDTYPLPFVQDNMSKIVESLVEVLVGTVDEISSGAVDLAMEGLENLQRIMFRKEKPDEDEQRLHVFVSFYSKNYFHGSADVRERIRTLLQLCVKQSSLYGTYDEFLHHFGAYFIADINRTLNTAPYMSLADSTASFDALYELINVYPAVFNFEKELTRWHRFIATLLDLVQNEASKLLHRECFKKSESCPAHFLPPIPICEQIEIMRANALRTLIACYHSMRQIELDEQMDTSNGDSKIDEDKAAKLKADLAISSYPITLADVVARDVKNPENRLAVVALRASLDLQNEIVSQAGMRALVKCAPLPLDMLTTIGEGIIRTVLSSPQLPTTEVVQLAQLFDLNPAVLTVEVADKIVTLVTNWMPAIPSENDQQQSFPSEVEAVEAAIRILAETQTAINGQQAIAIGIFAANFDHAYAQDKSCKWTSNVAKMLARFPTASLSMFFSAESMDSPARRALFRKVIRNEEALALRESLIHDVTYFEKALESKAMNDAGEWMESSGELTELVVMEREMLTLTVIDLISRTHKQWFVSPTSPIGRLKQLWNNPEFKKRYVVRSPSDEEAKRIPVRAMTDHKYKVPKLVVNCFLRYLRLNFDDYELLFDVLTVFIGNYVTDFYYVREFLEKEIIPVMSSQWRRDAFLRVMEKFETNPEKTVNDLRIVKTVQYLIIPCLQWSFERYDVDEIIGEPHVPSSDGAETADEDMSNLVASIAKVVDVFRTKMSDGMVIVFSQLCTLFVQYASHHIHNNSFKKQGARLRVFMLFAWPCLTTSSHQDPTTRYTSMYFLANIIERFTINRKIVLQVFNCLTSTYLSDNRDQIRKAIDILTPAVPLRMEDGYHQILTNVRRVLLEESHNLTHVQHVYSMIVRNYRVYFHVRQELITPLMISLQRAISTPNNVLESIVTRKLAVDVCEMVIKWDLLRIRQLETQVQNPVSAEEALEVDRYLEKLKSSSGSEKDGDGTDAESTPTTTTMTTTTLPQTPKVPRIDKDDPNLRPIPKEHVDQIVNMLVRFALQQTNVQQVTMIQSTTETCKKSQGLLRAALKASVWGDIATIRPAILEKQMTIPSELINMRQEGQANQLTTITNQAQQALELILMLCNVMPKPLLLQTMRPLQRAIMSCLGSGASQLVRHAIALVGRLFERTQTSRAGLEELDMLNQFIGKYLHEQFVAAHKSQSTQVHQIYTAFSLLRTICVVEPSYVDECCLNAFIRVTEKAAREHLACAGQENNKEKGVGDLVCLALDLLKPRIEYVGQDNQRYIAHNILLLLMERTKYDKVIDALLRFLGQMVEGESELAVFSLPILVRMQLVIEKNFRMQKDLRNSFLGIVLKVYENETLRRVECVERLMEGFYWGLTTQDAELREKFLDVWEGMVPQVHAIDAVARLRYVMRHVEWSRFNEYFWLRHAFWLVMRAVSKKNALPIYATSTPTSSSSLPRQRKRMCMSSCATLWRTFVSAGRLLRRPGVDEMKPDVGVGDVGGGDGSFEETLKTLLEEQLPLLNDAAKFDFADTADCIANIAFSVPDTGFIANIWIALFTSMWTSMGVVERATITSLIVPFLGSGTHCGYVSSVEKSVLTVWLRAANKIVPEILPPTLVKYIATRHECWHLGIEILEQSAVSITPMTRNAALFEGVDVPTQHNVDVLEMLAELYYDINELDQFAAAWERRAVLPETKKIVALAQVGDMEGVQQYCEEQADMLYGKLNQSIANAGGLHTTPLMDREYSFWFDQYRKSLMELMRWEDLREVCGTQDVQDLRGLMLSGIHFPDWALVEECRNQTSGCVPPDFLPQFTIYNAMLTLMVNDESLHLPQYRDKIRKSIDDAINVHILRWRSLPPVISNAHAKILQAMNVIREIEECVELRLAVMDPSTKFEPQVLSEMKTVIKVWRNRTPTVADELGFVSLMYDWRIQMHTLVLRKFEEWDAIGRVSQVAIPPGASSQSILPIHSAAQAQIAMGRYARQLGFHSAVMDKLNQLATMLTLPMLDAHQKVCEATKTLRALAASSSTEAERVENLHEAMEQLESVIKPEDLNKEQMAKLLYQKGCVHSALGQNDQAMSMFSAASEMIDLSGSQMSAVSTNCMKSWAHHLYKEFFNGPCTEENAEHFGRQALNNYLCAARVENEPKARKYIAKIVWLAKHVASVNEKTNDTVNRVIRNNLRFMNVYNYLYWLPQMMIDVKRRHTSGFNHILLKLARAYPMQTFYALRDIISQHQIDLICAQDEMKIGEEVSDEKAFMSDPPPIRVLRVTLRHRPTDVRVFNRMLTELDRMSELWVERHLRLAFAVKDSLFDDLHVQYETGLQQTVALQNTKLLLQKWRKELAHDVQQHTKRCAAHAENPTPLKLQSYEVDRGFLYNLKQEREDTLLFEEDLPRSADDDVGLGPEYPFVVEQTQTILDMVESLEKGADALVFTDFIVKWINMLKKRLAQLPKRIPLELSSEFLSQFTHRVACIEMPHDLLNVIKVRNHTSNNANPAGQYVSMVARFDPRVEIGIRGGKVARRIHIRAQTGKSCSFYLHKSVWYERATRVPQFFAHVNTLLLKDRESARRHLNLPIITQLRASGYTSLHEIASIQPYMQTADSGVSCPAAAVEVLHPTEMLMNMFGETSADDVVVTFLQRFSGACAQQLMQQQAYDGLRQANGEPFGQFGDQPMPPPQVLPPIVVLQNLFEEFIKPEFVSQRILQHELYQRYSDPTMYYMMRKQVTQCLATQSMLEMCCSLSPMRLADMNIQANTGALYNPNYRFEIRPYAPNELARDRYPVPFRLTPTFGYFMGISNEGDWYWSMTTIARCLLRREPEVILRALLFDEHAEELNVDEMRVCHATNNFVNMVQRSVQRITSDGAVERHDDIGALMIRARCSENLCQMSPGYMPWF